MRVALAAVLVVAALAGCGGDEEPVTAPSPTPDPTAVPTATPTPTPTPTATATPSPTATQQPDPEDEPGGAGDEEEARVPVRFVVGPDGIEPPQVSIPAWLAIELTVVNRTAEPLLVRLDPEKTLSVGPGEEAVEDLEGRRPGRYRIRFGEPGDAVIVTGAEPGP